MIDPSTSVFATFVLDQSGKICLQHWKERLKISKIAKFESDTSEASEDIDIVDIRNSCENLQTYCEISRLKPAGSYILTRLKRITLKLGSFTNLKALFLAELTVFP